MCCMCTPLFGRILDISCTYIKKTCNLAGLSTANIKVAQIHTWSTTTITMTDGFDISYSFDTIFYMHDQHLAESGHTDC